jgi:hypothetical protein
MNKYWFNLIIIVASLLSCSDDDNIKKTVYQARDIEGMWFCQENVTFLNVYNTSFQGSVISIQEEIPTTVENMTGTWSYYPSNNILRMQFEYERNKTIATKDYKLVKVEGNSLTLIDLDYNTLYTYHRVADYSVLAIGESFKMNAGSFVPSSYYVLNAAIADVDNKGNIVAYTAGTTFVSASSGGEMAYARLDVLRIPYYQEELFSSIDSVFENNVNPDYCDFYEKDAISNMRVSYHTESTIRDKGLKQIVYTYDDKTREITTISTVYKEDISFAEDISYIKERYYDVLKDGTTYGLEPTMENNEFYIMQKKSQYGEIIYINHLYFKKNKHY